MTSLKKRSDAGNGAKGQNAIELLKADHKEVDQLFEQFKEARGRRQRTQLVEKIATALNAHTIIEEEIFYPACSEHGIEEDDLDEAQVEHDTIKLLIRELIAGGQGDDYYDAKVTVLSEYVQHHVKEEEEPEKGIFARVEKTDLDLDEVGRELQERKDELMEDPERLLARPPRIRSLHLSGERAFRRDDADHDPRGREGHGASRGEHNGWYGDPRGHADAARRGWRHRES